MEFIIYSLLGGIALSLLLPVLGCFMIWNKMTYLSDSLSHSAILGIAIALALDINYLFGLGIICIAFTSVLLVYERDDYPPEVLFGYLSSLCLALALTIAFMTKFPQHLENYLFGDILLINVSDLYIILALLVITWLWLWRNWSGLLITAINVDLAEIEGVKPRRLRASFILLLGMVIAVSLKIIGALLISAMLIIPVISVRRISHSPEQMVIYSIVAGAIAIIAGFYGSYFYDIPSGPAIIIVAALGFIFVNLAVKILDKARKQPIMKY